MFEEREKQKEKEDLLPLNSSSSSSSLSSSSFSFPDSSLSLLSSSFPLTQTSQSPLETTQPSLSLHSSSISPSETTSSSIPPLESSESSIPPPIVSNITWALMRDYSPEIVPTWHSASHIRIRESIRRNISQLILQKRPNSNEEWLEKLIEVSHKVEERLYYTAPSFDDYCDIDTLLERSSFFLTVSLSSYTYLPLF